MTARSTESTQTPTPARPPAWAVLEQAIAHRRSISVCYHNQQRLFCPHALGRKAGRAKLLAYQPEPATTHSATATDPPQPWRSLFVDEIKDPAITDHAWQTADNYTPDCNNIDEVEIDVNSQAQPQKA